MNPVYEPNDDDGMWGDPPSGSGLVDAPSFSGAASSKRAVDEVFESMIRLVAQEAARRAIWEELRK